MPLRVRSSSASVSFRDVIVEELERVNSLDGKVAFVIEIDSPGGRLDAVRDVVETIRGYRESEDIRIFGMARREMSQEEFLTRVREWFDKRKSARQFEETAWAEFSSRLTYCSLDATQADGLTALRDQYLDDDSRDLVVDLATPPSIFGTVCQAIRGAGLARSNARIVVEKPLGEDRASYLDINQQLTRVFEERQVYRIDHYLGKETVQNLLALRFANTFLEPLWNNKYIDNVQITVAESIGVSGRWSFYDDAGALRDMVQNHLLQLVCLAAMEPPAHLESTAVRNEQLKVLSSLRPLDEETIRDDFVIGQYTAGNAEPCLAQASAVHCMRI